MRISKPRSLVARLVTAGAAGLVIAIGLFAILFHVVNVPFEPGVITWPAPPHFTRTNVPTPPNPDEVVPPPKPQRPELVDMPTLPDWTNDPQPEDRRITGVMPGRPQFDPRGTRGLPGGFGGGGYTGGTDQEPIKVVGIPPEYPMRALIDGTEGWVRVRFTISPNGAVRDPIVVSAEPRGTFDAAALTAIARWRYSPRIVDGVAVERVGVETLIEFRITE